MSSSCESSEPESEGLQEDVQALQQLLGSAYKQVGDRNEVDSDDGHGPSCAREAERVGDGADSGAFRPAAEDHLRRQDAWQSEGSGVLRTAGDRQLAGAAAPAGAAHGLEGAEGVDAGDISSPPPARGRARLEHALAANRKLQAFVLQLLTMVETAQDRNAKLQRQLASGLQEQAGLYSRRDLESRLGVHEESGSSIFWQLGGLAPADNDDAKRLRPVFAALAEAQALLLRPWTQQEDKALLRGVRFKVQEKQSMQAMAAFQGPRTTTDAAPPRTMASLMAAMERIRQTELADAEALRLVHGFSDTDWDGICQLYVPDRSGPQCRVRWQQTCSPEVTAGPWSAEEDVQLQQLVQDHRGHNFPAVATALSTGRTAAACLQRWNARAQGKLHGEGGEAGRGADAEQSGRGTVPASRQERGGSGGAGPGWDAEACWSHAASLKLLGSFKKHGRDWDKITADMQPLGFSKKQCIDRWNRVGGLAAKGATRRLGKWSEQEDSLLRRSVAVFGENFAVAASFVGSRTAQQCRERWSHVLNPGLSGRAWTHEEDRRMLELAGGHKSEKQVKWKLVAAGLRDRQPQECAKRFKTLAKLIRKQVVKHETGIVATSMKQVLAQSRCMRATSSSRSTPAGPPAAQVEAENSCGRQRLESSSSRASSTRSASSTDADAVAQVLQNIPDLPDPAWLLQHLHMVGNRAAQEVWRPVRPRPATSAPANSSVADPPAALSVPCPGSVDENVPFDEDLVLPTPRVPPCDNSGRRDSPLPAPGSGPGGSDQRRAHLHGRQAESGAAESVKASVGPASPTGARDRVATKGALDAAALPTDDSRPSSTREATYLDGAAPSVEHQPVCEPHQPRDAGGHDLQPREDGDACNLCSSHVMDNNTDLGRQSELPARGSGRRSSRVAKAPSWMADFLG